LWDTRAGLPPPGVVLALHTGPAESRDADFFGPALNRTARLLGAGHGGQILLTGATADALGTALPPGLTLRDLGTHRFRDLKEPERVYQLVGAGLPDRADPLRALPTSAHNLPIQLTPFIGRADALAAVQQMLAEERLVTLTGSGGTGKTRLALQAAAEALDRFPAGIWAVELAALTDPALLAQTVATVLGVHSEAGRSVEAGLIAHLQAQTTLLLLDNCEHLLAACATLVERLLATCPGVTILASSREPLGLPGEAVYRVPSLGLPPAGAADPADLAAVESVRLFLDRVQAVQPHFRLTADNAPAVAQICRRLDGIPLAIELAAARVRLLPVEGIAARLDDRFRLLTGGSRTALPRQQTLRALIDWSYDLLPSGERRLLRALSVFAGGFTAEAAAAVVEATDPPDPPFSDTLQQLVNKSLVLLEPDPTGTARYSLLETIRQYTRDRLAEAGEAAATRTRHRDWFLALAEAAEAPIREQQAAHWLNRVEREHDNLRAALAWSHDAPDGLEAELRLAGALQTFWIRRGYWIEGRAWLEAALDRPGPAAPAARAKALEGAGRLATGQGDFVEAHAQLELSVKLYRQVDEHQATARTLVSLSWVAQRQGDSKRAASALEEGLALYRMLGSKQGVADVLDNLSILALNRKDAMGAQRFAEESLALQREAGNRRGIASSLTNLGEALRAQQKWIQAVAVVEEALALEEGHGDTWGIALASHNLGQLVLAQGDSQRAAGLFTTSTQLYHQLGNKEGIAMCLAAAVGVAAKQGQWLRAAQLCGATDGLLQTLKAHLDPTDAAAYAPHSSAVQAALADAEWTAAWTAGQAMLLDEAIVYSLDVK
ncbi:MAG: tetratricopeptide repeat protein, partial [Chloroflexota bacterium]|nr:tetratricopeptide repeat protein [Chloroflexota bacterium]